MEERQAWGKANPKSGTHHLTHHLAHHSADVAAVFEGLLTQPVFRRRAEAAAGRDLSRVDVARLTALAFLHDIGKLAPAFQAKAWPKGMWRRPTKGHLETAFHWCEEAEETLLDGLLPRMADWGDLNLWLPAAFAHHGRPVSARATGQCDRFQPLPHYDWRTADRQMGQALRAWMPEAFEPGGKLPDRARFVHHFAGLLALADWVGSDKAAFPFLADFDLDYWAVARKRAERRLAEIGLDPRHRRLKGAPDFALVTHHAPNKAQEAVGAAPTEAQLLILEAETGSGKTEAALWRFAALRAAGAVEGMYFAVPTRAAARQLHGRVNAALARMFTDPPEAVLAIPGMVQAGAALGKRLPDWKVLWDDDAGARASRWAAEHATRYLAAEVAVGTVDQAMLAALMVKHAHLRGAALSRNLLVIDEVHASDPYMAHVQGHLLHAHLALGGHAMLMSATLGSAARARWLGQLQPCEEEAVATPYPAVWVAGETGARAVAGSGRAKTVEVSANRGWTGSDAAEIALAAARQGARVLVIRNTVPRARETWQAACEAAPDLVMQVAGGPALHHSRFAVEDRAVLDAAVERALGKASGQGGVVVIGTQTLEQSLDIDADLLVTDLCPMDVLLQRIGRLHRHDRARPEAFAAARAVVLCPDELDPLLQSAENGLGAIEKEGSLSGVYVNMPAVAATLEKIEAEPVWRIPEMNRALVEAATHPDALTRVADARGWENYRRRHVGKDLAEIGLAGRVVLDRDAAMPKGFPDDEAIKTRIGEEGAVIEIENENAPCGPFGSPVSRIALPAQWSRGLSGKEGAVAVPEDEGLLLHIADRVYRYGRGGLEKA